MMNVLQSWNRVVHRVSSLWSTQQEVRTKVDEAKILSAKILINQMKQRVDISSITEAEFNVFSQSGDDGILQYLIHQTRPASKTFVEFGVQNYTESNTRFLLMNDNWNGLVIDGSESNINYIKNDGISWRYGLNAVHAWIDKDNINALFSQNGIRGEIGILSIDIDGNDYWVWEQINGVAPVIVIVEYNSVFGGKYAFTVPYDPNFYRTQAHYSNLYWGSSLKALELLGEKKGYALVGSNSAGNNAYFVRKDKLGALQSLAGEDAFVVSSYRESRDKDGNLTYVGGEKRLNVIADMPVYDIEANRLRTIREVIGK
jgi:hypothetical protein